MVRRIVALSFIFICTTIAWMILGATIFARTYDRSSRLSGKVASSWGTSQEQRPPSASYSERRAREVINNENGKQVSKTVYDTITHTVPLVTTRVRVAFDLNHRQKGLLWYSTYGVNFAGDYTFRNDTGEDRDLSVRFPLPAAQAIYDNLQMTAEGKPLATTSDANAAFASVRVPAGQAAVVGVSYRSQGLDTWKYKFADDVAQVSDFELRMSTNFQRIDFPENTLSPTEKRQTANGWDLTWRYNNLLSGFAIGMDMPEKLQPGPLAGRISFFAPVSLLFFFFMLFIITTMRNIELHPMNYFFLATAFFAFHLLLAYLVDHISIHLAFVICSVVSIFLVISYLRLVVGMRFALVEAGISQLIYLVLFSYAFFFEGFSALSVTIGAIITLFVVMQMTGRIRWAEKFAAKAAAR